MKQLTPIARLFKGFFLPGHLQPRCLLLLFHTCLIFSCKTTTDKKNVLFEALDNKKTGINFTNKLHPTEEFNVLKYMYFYNGGGVGAGDFNNDGKIDLFFASNQEQNKLFLNTGNLQFRDVTAEAQIPNDSGWSTGISVVDINNDGMLDIYICRVGNLETLHSHNLLLVCQGIDKNGVPIYKDEAKDYGLDFSGFSTQAVFFDYDMDGDLDMYLLNHSIHQNGTFGKRSDKLETFNPLTGDRLYRNDGNKKFTDVTKQANIHSSVIGYGLGIVAADINLDGYPDLYVGNDFHENDYMYINQHDGTFRDELDDHLMHTSQYTMGVDIGDINNDGFPDIISMDMLPSDPEILKRSLGEDEYDLFAAKIGYGYNHQYTRNNLQLNRRNGMFSEIGMYSGVFATDWSWSPLWIDFDNDGCRDLFVSNGIPKRLNDIDYLNFISNEEIQNQLRTKTEERTSTLMSKFPEIKLPNKFFKNDSNLKFTDLQNMIDGDRPTFSNGAAFADLDKDGDLDIVVNNIDDPVILYQNKSNDLVAKKYADIKLKGSSKNINAIGSKIILFANQGIRVYEKYPARGFLSTMETPVHVGLENTRVDSAFLVWPDNSYQRISFDTSRHSMEFNYHPGLPAFDYSIITTHWKNPLRPMRDITNDVKLQYLHKENDFHEFDREPLLPHMLSTEGPALAIADINHDGLEDVFIGSSKREKSAVFLQDKSGTFKKLNEPALDLDSTFESVDACWTDVNHDGNPDLVIACGGNEYFGSDEHLTPRIYLNDGKGSLTYLPNSFDQLFVNASCISPCDFNGDGFIDFFVGGRSVPFDYGQVPHSYLLQNDGTGKFKDVTSQYAPEISKIGFVTQAQWFDIDRNGKKDLLLTLEWGGIVAFLNQDGKFTKKVLSDRKGWWNFVLPVDIDNDGDYDLIAGNLGLNSRLQASPAKPVRIYYYDFDGNGKKEQILTYFLEGREIPFANKEELEKQIPGLKKRYLYAQDFAKASLEDLFSLKKLQEADTLSADFFSNAVLINQGNLNFTTQALPWQAQLSPYRDALVINANNDSLPDILLLGNYYDNNIQMGRYDADFGTILVNKGKGQFTAESINGLAVKGEVRHAHPIKIAGKEAFVLARNNDSTMVIQFADAAGSLSKPTKKNSIKK